MLFCNIGIIDEKFCYLENMYVGIIGDKIDYIGTSMPSNQEKYGEKYFGKDKVLLPGFVNSHAHSPMCLMRGYGENLPLDRWLFERIFPFEDKLYSDAVYWATLLSMAESIRYGIVSTSDMYFFIDDIVRAVSVSGAKSNISRAVANANGEPVTQCAGFKEMKESIISYNGLENGRIVIEASAHAEYTNNEETLRAVAETASEYDVGIHIHLSETEKETNECFKRHGVSPVRFMDNCGIFDSRVNAAHCVWLSDDDIKILATKGVSVSSNPVSNLKLASGIADVNAMYEKGINVGIGTDSTASNNSLNFLEDMKILALMGKIKSNDPSSMPPEKVLQSATRSGAILQGRIDCGLIKEGYKADIIVIDTDTPNMKPTHNMINNLIYSASGENICLTMCDGRILYQNGEYKTIDIEKTFFEVEIAKRKILSLV